ncbi:riboflavin synthase [Spirochaeta cellobiosiphila]|uniref:riboflavin synthase n=1 Tax=Spirochaeta cellobiosiphila TaxID=504483 RepID=UPI0004107644|nr:riboflavin synthase [Spirochaeta cellobiosiphila]
MFTGIIQDLGRVEEIQRKGKSFSYCIHTNLEEDLPVGSSLAVNGVCQTVVKMVNHSIHVEVLASTLEKTNLGCLKTGSPVNLERALKMSDYLDGHLVQGHVETTVVLQALTSSGLGHILRFTKPQKLFGLIPEGSICLDGVSLTISALGYDYLEVQIIPETWKRTLFHTRRPGDHINIETDILLRRESKEHSGVTKEKLQLWGY